MHKGRAFGKQNDDEQFDKIWDKMVCKLLMGEWHKSVHDDFFNLKV